MSTIPRAQQPFSLFPSSVPKIATPNPHKRTPTLHKIKPLSHLSESQHPTAGASWNGSNTGEAVSKAGTYTHSRSPSPNEIGKAETTMSPVDGTTPSIAMPTSTTSLIQKPNTKMAVHSAVHSATTLAQNMPSVSVTDPSPVVPIRSMFPTYNPSVPLAQQNYYPQQPLPAPLPSVARSNLSRSEYRNTLGVTPVDRALGARSIPASVFNLGVDGMSINEPPISSHRELDKLWEASHGAEPNLSIKSFTLEMARTEDSVFTFGADPQHPFYTLSTFDTAEISIKKTSPKKRLEVKDVIMSSIELPARRLPPHDGLVAFIFPKMAAMLALSQSAVLAQAHSLVSVDKDEMEAAAVRRAAKQEACYLRWNANANHYELEHPAIARQAGNSNFIMSPASPEQQQQQQQQPVLHITISSNSRGSTTPPVILVTNPQHVPTPASSAGPGIANGIRLSTIPQSDTDSPLASLNLGNMTLSINASQILSLMPSLFAIDSVVSSILAVAVADESTNPVLGTMPIWTPRRRLGAPPSLYSVDTGHGAKSCAGSVFYATIAEREEAEEEAVQLKKEHEKDVVDCKKRRKVYTGKRTWYGKREVAQNKKKQVVVREFDLEKLGHYQAGDRKGQEMPAITRVMVGGLVAILRFVVWILTTIVRFLVWILVSGTRCVTSEKF